MAQNLALAAHFYREILQRGKDLILLAFKIRRLLKILKFRFAGRV
jgi:hypothetical protein